MAIKLGDRCIATPFARASAALPLGAGQLDAERIEEIDYEPQISDGKEALENACQEREKGTDKKTIVASARKALSFFFFFPRPLPLFF